MVSLALSLVVLAGSTTASPPVTPLVGRNVGVSALNASAAIPSAAQIVDQRTFNVLETVEPASVKNATTPFILPGATSESMKAKPFHIYDKKFLEILGSNPTFKLISENTQLLAHEAAIWLPSTDDMFFAQNAGGMGSGTGIDKSNVISVINLKDVANLGDGELINATTVPITPGLEMTNGGTNWKGQLLFANQGRGADLPANLAVVNPYEPYNASIILNNFMGRQFNSLNDIRVHPSSKDIYFTDTTYGYSQNFRPLPGLPQQVYRFNPCTGAVTVVADGFTKSNGIVFSPSGDKAYIADTGAGDAFFGFNFSRPSTIYSFDVEDDGTWSNRKTFAFVDAGLPDGLHCDTNGNLYAGVGDGISVWSPNAKLLGKIYHGAGTANFAFAGKRLFVMAENRIYFATLDAEGASYEYDYPSCEAQEAEDDD